MADPVETDETTEIAFEAYGVRLSVDASEPAVLERIRQFLPPGSQPCPPESVECRFSLTRNRVGTYSINRNGKELNGTGNLHLDLALELFDSQLRIYLGRTAPDAIFIHAGAVSHRGVAMVMPGMSFAGKTTLVAALVRAGAVYYSDEYAVIDRDGFVTPYAKALSIRGDGWAQTDHTVESQGGVAGTERVPLGMIVITSYQAGAEWSPKVLSRGAGAMALLANAVPARERSKEVMDVISRAAEGAVVIESERGDADAVAPLLLHELERHATTS
jgi:hypothetical protein